jgi:hypothetical protein
MAETYRLFGDLWLWEPPIFLDTLKLAKLKALQNVSKPPDLLIALKSFQFAFYPFIR